VIPSWASLLAVDDGTTVRAKVVPVAPIAVNMRRVATIMQIVDRAEDGPLNCTDVERDLARAGDHSWPTLSGAASCRWVRPILTTPSHCWAFPAIACCSEWTLGSRRSWISLTAAMFTAVGNVSLDDWPMLTSSLGWIGVLEPSSPPTSWMQRLLITSLTFMFDWVPEPVDPSPEQVGALVY